MVGTWWVHVVAPVFIHEADDDIFESEFAFRRRIKRYKK